MRISTASEASGVRVKTIRYYESIGLIEPAERTANGYRSYSDRDIQILHFIQRSRRLGFSICDVSRLLALWSNKSRASANVRVLALEHMEEVERRIKELESIRDTLLHLVHECHGDDRPDCPILDNLAGGAGNQQQHRKKGETHDSVSC